MAINYDTNIIGSTLFTTDVLTDADYQTPGNFGIPEGYGIDCITSFTLGGTLTGYTAVPGVSLSGSGGGLALAVLAPTTVASVSVTAAGTGFYGNAPTPVFVIGNAGAVMPTATSTLQLVAGGSIFGGTGYAESDTITLVGGTHTTVGTLTVLTVTDGAVSTFSIDAAGAYSIVPVAGVAMTSTSSGDGTGFTLIPNWGVNTVTLATDGSNITVPPTVIFPGGTGATATVALTSTSLASIVVVNGGSYPDGAPTVTISSGSATATATIGGPAINRLLCFVEIMRSYISQLDSIHEAKLLQMTMSKVMAELHLGGPSTFSAANASTNAQSAAMSYIFEHMRPEDLDV